jgi:hypothetical protein
MSKGRWSWGEGGMGLWYYQNILEDIIDIGGRGGVEDGQVLYLRGYFLGADSNVSS